VWFPPEKMICAIICRAAVSLGDIGGQLHGIERQQSEVLCLSTNYGRSRIYQMLAKLSLQFSVLHFCSSKRTEKKPKKKKKEKIAF
jgi:hypothetical protein